MNFELIGRNAELSLLDRLWSSDQAQFLILYGRRRVGKTTLLTHWLKTNNNRGFYWVAEPTSSRAQLRSFSQALYNFANPAVPAPDDFSYASWQQAWEQAAQLAANERLVIFIDEFTYLLEVEPGFAAIMQNLWDHHLKQTQIFLALSGSHMGMMKREFLSYQAPLYGRATAQIYLQPLPYGVMQQYFSDFTPEERVHLYAIFGGIPAYWERINRRKSLAQNIKEMLLTPNNLMQAEPRLLLHDFISEPHNYISILEAIARGARTPKEIEVYTGLSNVHVPKYLSVLNTAGFVERRVSVFDDPGSRSGRHHVTDPYLRFYYRFISTRQEQLVMGIQEQAYREIERSMVDFVGANTWEELCRQWVLMGGLRDGGVPFMVDRCGSAWNTSAQVDVVGFNRAERRLLLGECKWMALPLERKVIVDLIEKADKIIPKNCHWNVEFVVFSRSGWAASALNYAEELNQNLPGGENWSASVIRLLSLSELDRDMAAWSQAPQD
ncbi:MAG: ATP-binding protein [Anaerolineae bacterium]|nr:ATP-binding protein [Anaerolineae bacterium]